MIKNLSLEKIEDVLYLLRRPREELKYLSPEEMVTALREAEQKITVHHYPLRLSRSPSKNLLELGEWSYHQIYLAMGKEIGYCLGHGRSSGARERHNQMIDAFLEDKVLQQSTPTAVLVTHKSLLLAYYFHQHYAYVAHDVGMNWGGEIALRLKRSRLPCSERRGPIFSDEEVWFKEGETEKLVYRAVREDIHQRRMEERLREMAEGNQETPPEKIKN
ncbi:hypothetical protein HZC30_02750 [Candidatus Woesearchaeota archaeon]|nr:hypothetical protein [Candidatus Woesearchaeota archaeon]